MLVRHLITFPVRYLGYIVVRYRPYILGSYCAADAVSTESIAASNFRRVDQAILRNTVGWQLATLTYYVDRLLNYI